MNQITPQVYGTQWRPRPMGPARQMGAPLRPRRVEVEYLMARVQREIDRSEDVLPPQAIEEYRQALREYRDIAATAR